MDNKREINLFCTLVGRHNLAFYISGSDDCQQMEGEGADRVSQTATPCNYPDASRGASGMDQDDSVLMKAALQKSTRRLPLRSLKSIATAQGQTPYKHDERALARGQIPASPLWRLICDTKVRHLNKS